jgi:hypothetical protein
MIETTAMTVRTPMMIPRRVRNERSLLDRRDVQAMDRDSRTCSLAMVNLLFYTNYTVL